MKVNHPKVIAIADHADEGMMASRFDNLQQACTAAQEHRTACEIALHDAINAERQCAHAFSGYVAAAMRATLPTT